MAKLKTKVKAQQSSVNAALAVPLTKNNADSFYVWEGDVLVLNVLGKPSAKKDAIGKPKGKQLKISVTAAPVGGKATDHMVRFLALAFGVGCGDIEVVFGRMNVNKQLRITSPTRLPAAIERI